MQIRSRARATAVAVVTAAVMTVAGCGGGSEAASSPGRTTTGTASTDITAGENKVGTGGLSLALPSGVEGPAANLAGATVTYRGLASASGGPEPVVALYVERGAVGPLELRTNLLATLRSKQVGVQPVGPARAVGVPGATGANVLEWRWTYPARGTTPSGSVRLVEVLVQTSGAEQYGVKFVGADSFVTDGVVNALLGSLRIDPALTSGASRSA